MTSKTVERWALWALTNGYEEVDMIACAHTVRRTPGGCPRRQSRRFCGLNPAVPYLDHVRLWRRQDGSRFLLAHAYDTSSEMFEAANAFADEWGLKVTVDPADSWYGFGTIPLRFDVQAG